MSKRARSLLTIAVAALAGYGYSKLSADWSRLEFYAGLAVVITMVGLPLTIFVELPKDPYPRLRRSRG
jgi:hypothetical protein